MTKSNLAVVVDTDAVRAEGVLAMMNYVLQVGGRWSEVIHLMNIANSTPDFAGTFHYDGEKFVYE